MPVSKSIPRLPSPPIKEKASIAKPGIVTVLRSDPEKSIAGAVANSIRRTISADMSSRKWLEQNGFPFAPMKKINHHPDSSSWSEGEEEDRNRPGHEDIWRSIQQEKEKNAFQKPNTWGSLVLTDKNENNSKSDLPPPYVHPLVNRSASTLSKKSLEICTESLGSETGSDCFPSYPASEFSDEDKKDRNRAFVQEEFAKEMMPFEDLQVKKYKPSPVRPFPPPIPSIAGVDGVSLHMHSKRVNGRLVLEAVSVPSRNHFHAQRQDGHLVLTLVNSPTEVEEEIEVEVFDMEQVDENDCGFFEEDEEEEKTVAKNIAKEMEFVKSTRREMISVNKTGLVMKKLVARGKMNTTWSTKVVNVIVEDEEQAVQPAPQVARLIPSPTPTAAASFNAYDYFRRKNTMINPILVAPQCVPLKNNYNGKINSGNQNLVISKEKKERSLCSVFEGLQGWEEFTFNLGAILHCNILI